MTESNEVPLRQLKPPARCTLAYSPQHVTTDLVKVVSDASSLLQDMLQTVRRSRRDVLLECGILSKMLYNSCSGHSRQKYYHGLKKIEKCLKRYSEMDLPAMIEDFSGAKPSLLCVGDTLRLPSRQMLEFVLVRLRDASCLLTRTNSYAMQTFVLVKQQMMMGLFVPKMVIFEGLLSRIWKYTQAMLTCVHTWYRELGELKGHIKATQADWLPEGFELPASLDDMSWLTTQDSVAVDQITAASGTDDSSATIETTLQRYCSPSLPPAVDDTLHEPMEESICVSAVTGEEDTGLPVQRQMTHTDQPSPLDASSRRRVWLTKLKSCTDVENMFATLEDLRDAIPGLYNNDIVHSTRSELVELIEALRSSGKQYKKKRKLLLKTSRKVLSTVVKKAFPKKN